MPDSASLRCGVAGWSYRHWDSIVYPRPKPRGFHPLEYLARYFDTVEINTSFYGTPRPEVCRLWLSKVALNPSFVFTAKLHHRFTHERLLDPAEVGAFQSGLQPLLEAGKLGCLLMQFPWSFRFTEENRDFFIRLRRAFHAFPLAAEMRHSSWMREEALGTFIDYRVAFCNIDQPPHTSAMPPTAFLTSATGYFRLHGRNCAGWFREFTGRPERVAQQDYLYSPVELAEWKERIRHACKFANAAYVITTNDAGGKSVVNALQLQAHLGVRPAKAPGTLARAYRGELEEFRVDKPVQNPLFVQERAVA
jgi:uncharacterized protein YecE (DUF72 family)